MVFSKQENKIYECSKKGDFSFKPAGASKVLPVNQKYCQIVHHSDDAKIIKNIVPLAKRRPNPPNPKQKLENNLKSAHDFP